MSVPATTANDPGAAERFYSLAPARIVRGSWIFGLLLLPVAWWRFGAASAAGFALGAALACLNFYWLARAVEGLAGRIVNDQSSETGRSIVARFLLRYLLIGLGAYVIFTGWSQATHGFLVGLCVPVAAMLGEAFYELYVALRRGL